MWVVCDWPKRAIWESLTTPKTNAADGESPSAAFNLRSLSLAQSLSRSLPLRGLSLRLGLTGSLRDVSLSLRGVMPMPTMTPKANVMPAPSVPARTLQSTGRKFFPDVSDFAVRSLRAGNNARGECATRAACTHHSDRHGFAVCAGFSSGNVSKKWQRPAEGRALDERD